MKELEKACEYIYEYSNNHKIDAQERWNNLFIMVCDLIDHLGCYKEDRVKTVLNMLNEYDFEKNREVK